MINNNLAIAVAYYTAMKDKDISGIEKYLHPNVQFAGPLSQMQGKEAVTAAVGGFMTFFKTLTIRKKFSSEDQAVIVYDLEFPEPIGKQSSVALLTIENGLITKIELFFDARPFDRK